MAKPLIHGDLADAAAALLLCQHESPLVYFNKAADGTVEYNGEEYLMAAREAASTYLVACFNYAATAMDDE